MELAFWGMKLDGGESENFARRFAGLFAGFWAAWCVALILDGRRCSEASAEPAATATASVKRRRFRTILPELKNKRRAKQQAPQNARLADYNRGLRLSPRGP